VGEWVSEIAGVAPNLAALIADSPGPHIHAKTLAQAGIHTGEIMGAFWLIERLRVRHGLPLEYTVEAEGAFERRQAYRTYKRQAKDWKRLARQARAEARCGEPDGGGKCMLTCEILIGEHAEAFPSGTRIQAGEWVLKDGTIIDDHVWLELPGGIIFDPTADQVDSVQWEGDAILVNPDSLDARHYLPYTTRSGISAAARRLSTEMMARTRALQGEEAALSKVITDLRNDESGDELERYANDWCSDPEGPGNASISLEALPVRDLLDTRLMAGGSAADWIKWFWAEHEAHVEEGRFGYVYLLDEPFVEPVVIGFRGDEPDIWDGWHRCAAAIVRGDTHVPAVVVRSPEPAPVPDLDRASVCEP
jgi:hypothetical protein